MDRPLKSGCPIFPKTKRFKICHINLSCLKRSFRETPQEYAPNFITPAKQKRGKGEKSGQFSDWSSIPFISTPPQRGR